MSKFSWMFIFLSATLFIIGVHQAMVNGIGASYWIFMFSIAFLLAYQYFKRGKASGNGE